LFTRLELALEDKLHELIEDLFGAICCEIGQMDFNRNCARGPVPAGFFALTRLGIDTQRVFDFYFRTGSGKGAVICSMQAG